MSGTPIKFGVHIEKQLARRGWTKDLVAGTIAGYDRLLPTRDNRHLPGGGQLDDPATAYINSDGSYVVVNDSTGDVVQISDRTRPDWKAPWD